MNLKNRRFKIIQIVPQLPPSVNGVGDYAVNLARQLRKDHNIETNFVVCDRNWQGANEIEGFAIHPVGTHSANAIFSLLSTDSDRQVSDKAIAVLLHYVGYGYAKRGCPVWLIQGLERWKSRTPNTHLVTMFHEIYASGPPWASSFWLSPVQKNLATRFVRLSDRTLTSRQDYAKILHKLSQGKHSIIPTLPVFSNIGEPKQVLPLAKRERHLVVFGGCSNRARVYQKSITELALACQLLGIEKICDIGLPTGQNLSSVNGVPVVEIGQQSAMEISSIMLNSLAGFFDYHPDFLAKSTIFSAYCAHGLLPVSSQCNTLSTDRIEAGKHYWIPEYQTKGLKDLVVEVQAIADNAHTWYHTHNLSLQAKTFAAYLKNEDT